MIMPLYKHVYVILFINFSNANFDILTTMYVVFRTNLVS